MFSSDKILNQNWHFYSFWLLWTETNIYFDLWKWWNSPKLAWLLNINPAFFQTPDNNEPAPSLRAGHRASLGFQLHFVDIFLEELAKIGGEDLPGETIQSLLTPFIAELARGDDERLSQHIEERIFHHLVSCFSRLRFANSTFIICSSLEVIN